MMPVRQRAELGEHRMVEVVVHGVQNLGAVRALHVHGDPVVLPGRGDFDLVVVALGGGETAVDGTAGEDGILGDRHDRFLLM